MEKILPQNIEAECGVLGSIIIDPEALLEVSDFLAPEDFYRDAHRTIYQVIVDLDRRRCPPDFITICDELAQRGKLEDVGDASYITSLISQVPTSGNVAYYGQIVERTSKLRQLIHAAGQIAAIAYEPGADGAEALVKAETLLRAISNKGRGGNSKDVGDVLDDYMMRLERISQEARGLAITGVPTGFTRLDLITGGLQKSDLIILAARPGEGKTSIALNVAAQLAIDAGDLGFKCLFFSAEMAAWQLAQRLLSGDGDVNQSKMRTADLTSEEWERLVRSRDRFRSGRLWIDDDASLSPHEMRNRARRHQAQYGLDLVIVDYLQLLNALDSSGHRYENRVEAVSEISRVMKAIARELQVPVIALSQLNRSIESRADKRPQLSDLRESGSLEQDADIVLFITRSLLRDIPVPPGSLRVPVELMLAKHRNGAQTSTFYWFDPTRTSFEEIDLDTGPEEPVTAQDWASATARLLAFPSSDLEPDEEDTSD